ncbi:MAG: hypothetical protein HY559_00930 [Gammaproteobacteria bacterium]|nr:hypothetical protein [Gammaproteobacteria bacterium]
MTSNHALKNKIVERIIALLSSLYAFGFTKPIANEEYWSTSITWMLKKIGVEIEIDWRDFDIFVLIVRLENGKMPNGYYVSGGQPCRYHLQKVISDRRWNVDRESLAKISPGKRGKRQSGKNSEDMMIDRFCVYKEVIDSCIEKLVEEEEMIFGELKLD